MGAVAPPELAAAVSEAGGFGMLGTARAGLTAPALDELLERVRARTTRPFGVNFIVSPVHLHGAHGRPALDLKCIEIAAKAARLVEFFYGDPSPRLVGMVHEGGALVSWQVGSRDEAVAAVEAGADLLVAQGIEAGGHVRGKIGLMALLGEVLGAVDVPVLAAGGIGTGRAMAAALAAGADGVRVGTRFVAAAESGAHPRYVEALIAARAQDTIYTEAFSVNWPNAPHRVLRSSIAAAEAFQGDTVGETTRLDGTRVPVLRFAPLTVDHTTTGAIDAMPFWAGESVSAVMRVQSASEIVGELADEAERLLHQPG
jgi:NAD(P)H-dependent flavin oxidoreductase YrpB (nitropropane dioxygenase family)